MMTSSTLLIIALIILILIIIMSVCFSNGKKVERYGVPPGNVRGVHQDELGPRGFADNPPEFQGSSASAISAYIMRGN